MIAVREFNGQGTLLGVIVLDDRSPLDPPEFAYLDPNVQIERESLLLDSAVTSAFTWVDVLTKYVEDQHMLLHNREGPFPIEPGTTAAQLLASSE